MRNERTDKIQHAMRAAQEDRRDELRVLLSEVTPRTDRGAPLDECWLAAEAAYLRGEYGVAIELFERFDRDPRAGAAAPWQRYLSKHRRAFAALQLGRSATTEAAIAEAEVVLRAAPELAPKVSDMTAMRGHLHELRGDFEAARASFELAHESAIERGDAHRALTTASDLGRVLGVLGRPADGLAWLARAEEHGRRAQNTRALEVVRLRRAMLLSALGQSAEALALLAELVEHARQGGAPDLLIDALARRSDVLRVSGRGSDAERDLVEAIRQAAGYGLVRHELYARKDLASLYLERAAPGDEARAATEFAKALRLAGELVPPQPLVLMQLAESVLGDGGLIGRAALSPRLRSELEGALHAVRSDSTSSVYQRRERSRAFDRSVARLSSLLLGLIDDQIRLATCVVLTRAGRVLPATGKPRRITPSEIATLRTLLAARALMTIGVLSERLGKSTDAATKSVMRLRSAIGDDLVVTRLGNERRYSLRLPGEAERRHVSGR